MKKLVALLLVLVMVVGMFAACDTNKPVETNPGETQGNQPAETKPKETEATFSHPITTDPITISILTTRHSTATNNAEDIWFFNWVEKWLHDEYGYNVTLDVQQTMEPEQQISLLLGTDSLPDIVWGIPLTTSQAVVYGQSEGMVMDMREWLNDTYMPNATKSIYDPANIDVLLNSTAPDGGIYGMPQISSKSYGTAASCLGYSQDRMFFNTTWLAENNLKMPTNMEEFYAVCEAYKGKKTADGQDVIPIMSNSDFNAYLEKAFWVMLGYYGGELSKYGTEFAIKNGKVEMPVYTEDYAKFIEVMNHLYTNGYLSPDYLTLDKDTVRGLTKAGVAGIVSDGTMGFLPDFKEWESMPWFPINDGDQIVVSTGTKPKVMQTWVSASTQYPEIVALILDYMYTVEGSALYNYGPQKGQDPLNMLEGYWYNEKGERVNSMVLDGTYGGYTSYCYQYVFSYTYVGKDTAILDTPEGMEFLGIDKEYPAIEILDTVTGKNFVAYQKTVYDHSNASGHWYLTNGAASLPYITTINLPNVYLSEEDALYAAEVYSVLENHIISESAKFITGQRPLDQIDEFQAELKGMGIEDYIALYRDAFASFMESYFG